MLAFQTSKKHAESMISCTWHACEQTSLCHALWKNLKFKLLYFQNKARYRAENMQANTFLNVLYAMKLRLEKSLYFWILVFYDITWKPRIGRWHSCISPPMGHRWWNKWMSSSYICIHVELQVTDVLCAPTVIQIHAWIYLRWGWRTKFIFIHITHKQVFRLKEEYHYQQEVMYDHFSELIEESYSLKSLFPKMCSPLA